MHKEIEMECEIYRKIPRRDVEKILAKRCGRRVSTRKCACRSVHRVPLTLDPEPQNLNAD